METVDSIPGIADSEVDAAVLEAEKGYDPEVLAETGVEGSGALLMYLHPQVRQSVIRRALADGRSPQDVVESALEQYLRPVAV